MASWKRYIRTQSQSALLRFKVFRQPPIVEVVSGPKPFSDLKQPRILILKLDHIGDFLIALSAMSDLRMAWPRASITLVCASWNVDLAIETKLFDNVVTYDFFEKLSEVRRKVTSERYTRFKTVKLGGPFDIAIDLRHDEDTRPLLEMVEANFRAGYAAANLKTPLDLELPIVEVRADRRKEYTPFRPLHAQLRLTLLVQAVIAIFRNSGREVIRRLVQESSSKLDRPEGRYIVVCPGAGKSTRKWPLLRLVTLCTDLVETTHASIVIVGAQQDREDARAITSALPSNRCRDLVGTLALIDLPSLFLNADLFIGYDSGITHLAAQLDVRTICIFSGASDARVWKPHGANVTLIKANIPCSPCYIIRREDCAIGVRCMEIISVADIMNVVKRMTALT